MTKLQDRRALVTGASRGIGAEIVRRLAADGAAVAFTYGRSAADGGTAVAIQADSADAAEVARSIDAAVAQLGGLDILVNNAGVAVLRDIESFTLEEFDRQLAVNVRAVWRANSVRAASRSTMCSPAPSTPI